MARLGEGWAGSRFAAEVYVEYTVNQVSHLRLKITDLFSPLTFFLFHLLQLLLYVMCPPTDAEIIHHYYNIQRVINIKILVTIMVVIGMSRHSLARFYLHTVFRSKTEFKLISLKEEKKRKVSI